MQLRGFTPYCSPHMVKSKIFDFYKQAKEEVITEMQTELQKGERFSLTFDEYTGGNRRYMCINVHQCGGKRWHLGLVRVWARQTAETLKKIIEYRLEEFHLSWDHIILYQF